MKSTFVWRFDEEDSRTVLRAVRVTVRTMSIRDLGEHQRLDRMVRQLWEERFPELPVNGSAGNEGEEEQKKPQRVPESSVFLDAYRRWAQFVPSTCGIEVVQYVDGSDNAELDIGAWEAWPWAPTSLEWLGWNDPDGLLDLPIDFLFAWQKAASEVNPGMWGGARTSDTSGSKKKMGLIASY